MIDNRQAVAIIIDHIDTELRKIKSALDDLDHRLRKMENMIKNIK